MVKTWKWVSCVQEGSPIIFWPLLLFLLGVVSIATHHHLSFSRVVSSITLSPYSSPLHPSIFVMVSHGTHISIHLHLLCLVHTPFSVLYPLCIVSTVYRLPCIFGSSYTYLVSLSHSSRLCSLSLFFNKSFGILILAWFLGIFCWSQILLIHHPVVASRYIILTKATIVHPST